MGAGDFAKFRLVIKASGNTITMDPVLITDDDGIDGLTILIGTPDLKRNQINVDIVTDEIVFPNNFRLPFDSCVPHTQTGRMSVVQKKTKTETNQRSARESATTIPPQETKQRPRNLACPTAPSSYAKAVKSDLQPKVDHFQIDARDKYRRRMENLNAEKQNTCTIEQVNWDPDLLKNDPELKKELARWSVLDPVNASGYSSYKNSQMDLSYFRPATKARRWTFPTCVPLPKLADGLILLPSGYQSPKMDFSYLRPDLIG